MLIRSFLRWFIHSLPSLPFPSLPFVSFPFFVDSVSQSISQSTSHFYIHIYIYTCVYLFCIEMVIYIYTYYTHTHRDLRVRFKKANAPSGLGFRCTCTRRARSIRQRPRSGPTLRRAPSTKSLPKVGNRGVLKETEGSKVPREPNTPHLIVEYTLNYRGPSYYDLRYMYCLVKNSASGSLGLGC